MAGNVPLDRPGRSVGTKPLSRDGNVARGLIDGVVWDDPVPRGPTARTIDLQVQFLAPALPGEYRGHGRVVRRGRDIGFMAGELRSADGTVVATATPSAIIRQRRF